MKIYKVTVLAYGFESISPESITEYIESIRYLTSNVMGIETADAGEWGDDHPLNHSDTQQAEFERLFADGAPKDRPISKKPFAYAVLEGDNPTHVTLFKHNAEYWATKGTGRTIIPLYDHPSREVIRQFAAWLAEPDTQTQATEDAGPNNTCDHWTPQADVIGDGTALCQHCWNLGCKCTCTPAPPTGKDVTNE